ncbi:hypothetical protein SRHO_G00237270 [Serrasalmus rhombeus]
MNSHHCYAALMQIAAAPGLVLVWSWFRVPSSVQYSRFLQRPALVVGHRWLSVNLLLLVWNTAAARKAPYLGHRCADWNATTARFMNMQRTDEQ